MTRDSACVEHEALAVSSSPHRLGVSLKIGAQNALTRLKIWVQLNTIALTPCILHQQRRMLAADHISPACRQFVELAFERMGMPIRWQGPKGMEEKGNMGAGIQAGKTMVMMSPQSFRPQCPRNPSGLWR